MNKQKVEYKLETLKKAVERLEECLIRDYENDEIILDATIQRFEFCYELAWKVLKTYLQYQGNVSAKNPRSSVREAFKEELIIDTSYWFDMIDDRNITSHIYDYEQAKEIYNNIKNRYINVFNEIIINIQKELE